MTMNPEESDKLPEFVKRLERFIRAKTLEEALGVVWKDKSRFEDYYCHYTTLPNLVSTILDGKWYLNKSLSKRFDDLQEVEKFGDRDVADRSYQLSFSKSVRESAAFWGLYGRNNPFAVKVLLPRCVVEGWIALLKEQNCDVTFQDVVYASIPLKSQTERPCAYDKKRGMTITWNNVTCNFGWNVKERSLLAKRLQSAEYTGWFKDHEWAFENESRLIVRRPTNKAGCIHIPYPEALLTKMSFTFSPWLEDGRMDDVRRIITEALKFSLKGNFCSVEVQKSRFHRSVLSGALNFKDEDAVRCKGAERCRFGMLTKSLGEVK